MSKTEDDLHSYNVFNHLDITVTVHETDFSKVFGHETAAPVNVPIPGYGDIELTIPEKTVRIVGFEVTPRSIPNG